MSAPRSSLGLGSLLVALVIILALGVGTVYAAIPNGNGTYYACHVKNTGARAAHQLPQGQHLSGGREAHQVERQGTAGSGRAARTRDRRAHRDRLAPPTGTPSPTSPLASLTAWTTRDRWLRHHYGGVRQPHCCRGRVRHLQQSPSEHGPRLPTRHGLAAAGYLDIEGQWTQRQRRRDPGRLAVHQRRGGIRGTWRAMSGASRSRRASASPRPSSNSRRSMPATPRSSHGGEAPEMTRELA